MYKTLYDRAEVDKCDAVFCGFRTEVRQNKWMYSDEVDADKLWRGKDVQLFMLDMIASGAGVKAERLYQMSVWHSIYKRSIIEDNHLRFVSEREAEPVVLKFLSEDLACFLLEYNLGPYDYPYPMVEGFAALSYIRKHKDEFHVDPNHIIVTGFSAGGHFAASLGAFCKKQDYANYLKVKLEDIKVNGLVLSYPVITMYEPTNGSTRDQLLNNRPDLKDYYSIEKQVTPDYPTTFIWTTDADTCVDSMNTLGLALALKKNKVKFELHYYPIGEHGASLANEIVNPKDEYLTNTLSYIASWIDLAINFIKKIV